MDKSTKVQNIWCRNRKAYRKLLFCYVWPANVRHTYIALDLNSRPLVHQVSSRGHQWQPDFAWGHFEDRPPFIALLVPWPSTTLSSRGQLRPLSEVARQPSKRSWSGGKLTGVQHISCPKCLVFQKKKAKDFFYFFKMRLQPHLQQHSKFDKSCANSSLIWFGKK